MPEQIVFQRMCRVSWLRMISNYKAGAISSTNSDVLNNIPLYSIILRLDSHHKVMLVNPSGIWKHDPPPNLVYFNGEWVQWAERFQLANYLGEGTRGLPSKTVVMKSE